MDTERSKKDNWIKMGKRKGLNRKKDTRDGVIFIFIFLITMETRRNNTKKW